MIVERCCPRPSSLRATTAASRPATKCASTVAWRRSNPDRRSRLCERGNHYDCQPNQRDTKHRTKNALSKNVLTHTYAPSDRLSHRSSSKRYATRTIVQDRKSRYVIAQPAAYAKMSCTPQFSRALAAPRLLVAHEHYHRPSVTCCIRVQTPCCGCRAGALTSHTLSAGYCRH